MSTEKLAERLAQEIDRRSFVKRLGAGAVGTLLALMGVTPAAAERTVPAFVSCCDTCNPPQGSCSGCYCQWCWQCSDCAVGGTYRCCECYSRTESCIGDCPAICSSVKFISPACR